MRGLNQNNLSRDQGWYSFQNIKVVYTGGYASSADIPGDIKRAAYMQIVYEVERRIAGRFANVPGQYGSSEFKGFEGLGLLGESRSLLDPWKRRIPFS